MEQIIKFGAKVDLNFDGQRYKDCILMGYPNSPKHWLVLFPKAHKPSKTTFSSYTDLNQPWLKEFSKDYYFAGFSNSIGVSRVRNFKLRKGYVEYNPEEMLLKEKVTIRFRGKDYEVNSKNGVSSGAFISEDSLTEGLKLFFVNSEDSIQVSEANFALCSRNEVLHLAQALIRPEFISSKPNTPYAERRKVLNTPGVFNYGYIFGNGITRMVQSCMDCVKMPFQSPVDFYVPLPHLEYLGFSEAELIRYVDMLNTLDLDLSIDFINELPKDAMDYFKGVNCLGTRRFLTHPEITKVRFRMNTPDNAGVNYLRVIFLRYLWSEVYGSVAKDALREYEKSGDAFYSIIKANLKGGFYHSWNIGREEESIKPDTVDWNKYAANCALYYTNVDTRASLGFTSFNSILHSRHSQK